MRKLEFVSLAMMWWVLALWTVILPGWSEEVGPWQVVGTFVLVYVYAIWVSMRTYDYLKKNNKL